MLAIDIRCVARCKGLCTQLDTSKGALKARRTDYVRGSPPNCRDPCVLTDLAGWPNSAYRMILSTCINRKCHVSQFSIEK